MKNILIVDAYSTGINYIDDIITRNYQPVVLYNPLAEGADPSLTFWNRKARHTYRDSAIFLDAKETFEETLAMVKEYDPILILPGSEGGVELAMKLSETLGLPGNPMKNLPNFIHKDCMQEALKKAGLRYIRGDKVSSLEEALAFYRENNLEGCVIKPVRGCGSVGVRICKSEKDLIEFFDEIIAGLNMFGESSSQLLIQELIDGTEYIVNTVSYKGVHRLAGIWRYEKQIIEGGGKIYDYVTVVGKLETGGTRLVRYAFDVADALGFEYGNIHGEYMIDKDGPVLIEVNCRPMGGGLGADFLDPIQGHHETDTILDTFLNPQWHYKEAKKPYKIYSKGILKLLINRQDTSVMSMPLLSIVTHLKSYHSASMGTAVSGRLTKTIDMETAAGSIYLRHDDPMVLMNDLEFLRKTERNYFGIFYNSESVAGKEKPENMETVNEIMDKYECAGNVLVLTNDQELETSSVIVTQDSIKEARGRYSWGIFDLNYRENMDLEIAINSFYDLVDKICTGGHIIIPQRSYWYFPHTTEAIEALCEVAGLTIEAPTLDDRNVILVSKEY